jgi:predicted NBD/HSP70 family sugar kinase
VGATVPTSRAEIASATGLTRATVSSLVDDLLRAGLIGETDPPPRTGAGRPATGLLRSAAGPAGLGLEINVDYLAACVVDPTGAVRHRAVRRVDQRDRPPEKVLAEVAAMAGEAVRATGRTVAGARLAVPGLVHPDGLVRLAPNLGWRDLDVRGPLTGAPDWPRLPVAVDNEANLAALGELAAAGDRPAGGSFLYVSGEVGIGAGIVLSGALFRGTHGWSGELGHVAVTPDGPVCRCGARGCLEQYAGQEAILRAAGIPGSPALSADDAVGRLVELAEAGDPAACRALREAGDALGVAVAGVVNLLDLDTVVLGGSFAPLAGWLAGPVGAELRTRVLTAAWAPVSVRASALGAEATVVGAAGAVVREILAAPAAWVTART